MKKTRLLSLALVLAAVLSASVARAENDQTVVIGLGIGAHTAEADQVRSERDLFLEHIYVEWYALDTVGFGVRRTAMLEPEGVALVVIGGFEMLQVTTTMLTVNWVALGSESYARLGLMAGLGKADYEYDGILFGQETRAETSGPAGQLSAYFDWGGDNFGARLGVDRLITRLDEVQGLEADASGFSYYLDLRWAF